MVMDYDTWLQSGPGGPFDDTAPGGDYSFTTKLRGGTIRVTGTASLEVEQDEDGKSSYWDVRFVATWTFHPDAEVDLSKDEEDKIRDSIIEMMEDI